MTDIVDLFERVFGRETTGRFLASGQSSESYLQRIAEELIKSNEFGELYVAETIKDCDGNGPNDVHLLRYLSLFKARPVGDPSCNYHSFGEENSESVLFDSRCEYRGWQLSKGRPEKITEMFPSASLIEGSICGRPIEKVPSVSLIEAKTFRECPIRRLYKIK